MNSPSKSAVPRNKSRKSDESMVNDLTRQLRARECKLCHYRLDSNRQCTNLDCRAWRDGSNGHVALCHGSRWGRWTFDAERYCLDCDATPTIRGSGKDRYVAFIGSYEADLERLRTSAAVPDFICQIRSSVWGINNGVRDFVNAIDDLLHPQATLCSGGASKTIENPKEFLHHRIAASQGGAS
jgi:hypothetical protein